MNNKVMILVFGFFLVFLETARTWKPVEVGEKCVENTAD